MKNRIKVGEALLVFGLGLFLGVALQERTERRQMTIVNKKLRAIEANIQAEIDKQSRNLRH